MMRSLTFPIVMILVPRTFIAAFWGRGLSFDFLCQGSSTIHFR